MIKIRNINDNEKPDLDMLHICGSHLTILLTKLSTQVEISSSCKKQKDSSVYHMCISK